jgi:predicted ATPase
MIKSININNFRVFNTEQAFEIKPITILIGKNSSGKSSFIKLLLMLKETIGIRNQFSNFYLNSSKTNIYSNKQLKNINNEATNFNISFILKDGPSEVKVKLYYSPLSFNSKRTFLEKIRIYHDDTLTIEYIHKLKQHDTERYNYLGELKIFNIRPFLPKNDSLTIKLNNSRDIYPYAFKENNNTLDFNSYPELKELFLKHELIYFKIYELSGYYDIDYSEDQCFEAFRDRINNVILPINTDDLLNEAKKITGIENLQLEANKDYEGEFKSNIKKTIEYFKYINGYFYDLHYLSPNRGSQNRIYNIQDESDDIYSIVNNHKELIDELPTENTKLILDEFTFSAFKLFGLDRDIKISAVEESSNVLKVKYHGVLTSIADIGFGYSQLIPIILKITNLAIENYHEKQDEHDNSYYKESSLILEEPEANLHPDFQSKLADLIVDAAKKYNIKFIIETHSEYFIRRLQLLTAFGKSNLKPEDSVIYYFNNPNDIKENEEQIIKIELKSNGKLSKKFGSGFFDEALKISLELFNFNSKKN